MHGTVAQYLQSLTLLVTGLQGRKCRLGMFRYTDSTCGTLQQSNTILDIINLMKLLHTCKSQTYARASVRRMYMTAHYFCYTHAGTLPNGQVPGQRQLCHLVQGELHRRAIDARFRRAKECLHKRLFHVRVSLVIAHRPRVPAHHRPLLELTTTSTLNVHLHHIFSPLVLAYVQQFKLSFNQDRLAAVVAVAFRDNKGA